MFRSTKPLFKRLGESMTAPADQVKPFVIVAAMLGRAAASTNRVRRLVGRRVRNPTVGRRAASPSVGPPHLVTAKRGRAFLVGPGKGSIRGPRAISLTHASERREASFKRCELACPIPFRRHLTLLASWAPRSSATGSPSRRPAIDVLSSNTIVVFRKAAARRLHAGGAPVWFRPVSLGSVGATSLSSYVCGRSPRSRPASCPATRGSRRWSCQPSASC
jgi:hypothetical protein